MKQTIKCVYCKKSHYVKNGVRKTKNRGRIQKYICLECGKNFTNDDGFYRMRNSENIITMSIDMYLSNLSSRKMRNQLKRHLATKISHVSVLDWVRKYVKKVSKYLDNFKPQLNGKIYADETEIQRGRQNDVFWCSVDWDTRYINATFYSPNPQNMIDAKTFLKRIKDSKEKPEFIQTDGLHQYNKAFKTVFSYHKTKNNDVRHIVNNAYRTGKHNVRIETVFSKIKDRVYDFRGLKALWSAEILLSGIVLQHNFIENHTTTGQLPCKLAGINLETGVNRWLGLINLACNV